VNGSKPEGGLKLKEVRSALKRGKESEKTVSESRKKGNRHAQSQSREQTTQAKEQGEYFGLMKGTASQGTRKEEKDFNIS